MERERTKDALRDFQSSLGETLRELRKTAKVSQTDLGQLVGVHQTAVCRIEKGTQHLTPEQLFLIARHFDVKIDSLIAGDIDLWGIAEKFGRPPPLPKKYREFAFSKVREILPSIEFLRQIKGDADTTRLFDELGIKKGLLRNPDHPMGTRATLDIAGHLLSQGMINQKNIKKLTDLARSESVQGFLHPIYARQEDALNLVQTLVLNSHHYDTNFEREIEECHDSSFVFSVTPRDHMHELDYKGEVLGNFLCEYRKSYLQNFPSYIGQKPLALVEKECHFKGQGKACVYKVKAA